MLYVLVFLFLMYFWHNAVICAEEITAGRENKLTLIAFFLFGSILELYDRVRVLMLYRRKR